MIDVAPSGASTTAAPIATSTSSHPPARSAETEATAREVLSLPMSPRMTTQDVAEVAQAVRACLG